MSHSICKNNEEIPYWCRGERGFIRAIVFCYEINLVFWVVRYQIV